MELIENRDAQFMLLAGFIIAIGLVITTAMLNSIIFESNMAGTTGTELKYDMVNLIQVTSDEMKSAYRNATYNASMPKTDMIASFTSQTQNFNSNLSKIYALHGEGVNISVNVSNWENARYANFTDNGTASGTSNWVVMENVKNFTLILNVTNIGVTISFTNATISRDSSFLTFGTYTINESNLKSTYTIDVTPPYTSIRFKNLVFPGAGRFNMTGNTTDGRSFVRARDYILTADVTLYTSRTRANLTIPVSVPW